MVVPTRSASEVSFSTMEELLEMCFGDSDKNVVDFKALHAILLLLARSMSMLDRQVFVNIRGMERKFEGIKTSIREVKISAKTGKAGKQKGRKGDVDVETPPPGGKQASDQSIQRPPLSLVTKEEYNRLYELVNKLYKELILKRSMPDLTLREAMKYEPSIMNAGSILQISDRLRTTEKTITQMLKTMQSVIAQRSQVAVASQAEEEQQRRGGTTGF